jgi:phosphatidylserine/phosphatidylglycerophosphate/cardiolipin synthase-like enzyme
MRHLTTALLLATLLLVSPAWANPPPSTDVAFSTSRGATQAVVKLIGEAKQSIRVAAYSFTSKDIAAALIDAHKRGVDVQAVLDKSNATARYTSATFLANMGLPTRVDYQYAIMHNNFRGIGSKRTENRRSVDSKGACRTYLKFCNARACLGFPWFLVLQNLGAKRKRFAV